MNIFIFCTDVVGEHMSVGFIQNMVVFIIKSNNILTMQMVQ